MADRLLPVEQVLTLLRETPGRIAAVTDRLTPEALRSSPGSGEWSANELLAHLRACADVRGGAALRILAEDTPTIRVMDPRRWMRSTDYVEQEFRSSLEAFTDQRADLLAALEPLGPEGWSRTAMVTGAGRPLERTVHHFADWIAIHERPHLNQLQRIVDAVRPDDPRTEKRRSGYSQCLRLNSV